MPRQKNQIIRICPGCGREFSLKASQRQIYCSRKCRTESTTEKKNCLNCGLNFTAYKSQEKKYCSISCGISARNRTDQNPSYYRDIKGEKNPMFGKGFSGSLNGMFGRTGEANPAWKGGRKTRKDGYVFIKAPKNHPYANTNGYILEHRLVMEKHLGRFLKPDEIVHHLDGDHGHNEIENLSLYLNQSEHLSSGHSRGPHGHII